MPRKISLLIIAAVLGASLAVSPGLLAAGTGSSGMGNAPSGAQSGFGGVSGGGGHGGFASPGAGSTSHSGRGGPSAPSHGATHSHGGAQGDVHRGSGTGTGATGFGAATPGRPMTSTGAKSVAGTATSGTHGTMGWSHIGTSHSAAPHVAHARSFAGDSRVRRHHDRFHHDAIPFLFFTGVEAFPWVTETEPTIEPMIEPQSVTISNDTDSEMTVLDSGRQICVLAPRARCSFETTSGHHDISVTTSGRQSSDSEDRGSHGPHMITVEPEAE